MKMKRWIGILLCMLLCVGILQTKALAAEPTVSVWDGSTVAIAYESGEGTEANPYEIATAEQFAYFAKQIEAGAKAGASYILTSDLDMTAVSWKPICDLFDDYEDGKYFKGSFDGQGHCITYQISELTNVKADSAVGLFGFAEGEIANLTVNGRISGISSIEYSWLGGICGLFVGNITNCVSNVDIRIQEGDSYVSLFGGMIGEVQEGIMQNCMYSGRMDLKFSSAVGNLYAGGIAGNVYAGKINACKNEGNITVEVSPTNDNVGGNAGGITGMAYTGGDPVVSEIRDCYNEGVVTSSGNAGGIAGVISAVLSDLETGEATSGVYNCYSSAEVVGDKASGAISPSLLEINYAGEKKGSANAIVENCYYTIGTDANGTLLTDLTELFQKLCEISEEGIWIQDVNGAPCLYWEFSVNPVPKAVFNATGDNSGTLSSVDTSMKYSVDGGNSWNDITGTTMEIIGVTADNDIKVYQPGDRMDTLDSKIQTIDVIQPALPTVGSADCTTNEQNDGQITGVDSTMEYKLSTASKWTEITGTSVTDLVSGTYHVRVKANGTVLASAVATVTIGDHICVGQEGWNSDKTNHWKLCVCGKKLNEAAHTFKWVIDKEATAMAVGAKHEQCTVCGYEKAAVEIPATGTTEKPSESPVTGDDSGVALWIATLLAAGAVMTGTAIYSCKRKYSK